MKIKRIADSLMNLVTGLGTTKDKKTYNAFTVTNLNFSEISSAFRADWAVRKIITIPGYDAIREWRTWNGSKEHLTLLEKEENKVGLRQKVSEAITKSRLWGGAIILIGVEGEDFNEPLNLDTIFKNSLQFVHVFDKTEISTGQLERNVLSRNFGKPEYYLISSEQGQIKVHPSRVVRFEGPMLPSRIQEWDGWGDSMLLHLQDAVKNSAQVIEGISTLVSELSVDVIKVPGLMTEVSSTDYRNNLIKRFQLANNAKSLVNALILDKEEEWTRMQASLANTPELVRVYLGILSSASDIPATRMLGQSPGGLNSTGDADMRNYYDSISAMQNIFIGPSMYLLDEVLIRSALNERPEELYYDWKNLWQPTENEKADVLQKNAASISTLYSLGTIEEEPLKTGIDNMIIESGVLPGYEDSLNEEEEEEIDESDIDVQAEFNRIMGIQNAS